MVKLVVADDEERVCRLIVALGNWEKLGIEVVGTAANGVEALEVVGREKADILITDIRMPGYGGLELIEKVRKLVPDIRIMIISGYANFDYAQTALKLGVKDYLLKPINKEALNDSLEKMIEEIRTERKSNQILYDIRREHEEEISKIRNMLILDLIHNRGEHITEEILEKKYHFCMQPGVLQVVSIKSDRLTETENDSFLELLWDKMMEIMNHELEKRCFDFIFYPSGQYLYGILNYASRNVEEVRKALRRGFNQMLTRNDFLGNSRLSMGAGKRVKRAEDIFGSFLSARHAVDERILEGNGRLLELENDNPVLFEKKLLDKFTRNISNAIQTLNIEEVKSTVQNIYAETIRTPGVHGWEIMELVSQCGNIFILMMDFLDKTELQEQFQEQCEERISSEELFEFLRNYMCDRIRDMITKREEDTIRPVRLAKQYIHNHYQDQITLDEVSEHVGLTTAYFSVLFKKETEIGFARYLMNERIEGAKVLLRETNMSVSEICRKVGYNDLKHFTRLFEKNVGVKPALYRKLYG